MLARFQLCSGSLLLAFATCPVQRAAASLTLLAPVLVTLCVAFARLRSSCVTGEVQKKRTYQRLVGKVSDAVIGASRDDVCARAGEHNLMRSARGPESRVMCFRFRYFRSLSM